MSDEQPRILIVEARYYNHVSDELMGGVVAALEKAGAEWDVVTVPGALEIPGVISIAEKGGRMPTGQHYDGYVALGCVIRGETTHYDYVCSETVRAIMDLTVGSQLAIGNGVLTVENEAQAMARARIGERDKGGFAARACLDVIAVRQKLLPRD